METFTFDYPADQKATARAHVGVVGSGDLEVLLEPSPDQTAHVRINTSVDGYGQVWKNVLDRFFTRFRKAVRIEINDFGATPGMVALRLEQAVEESRQ
ncbi:malonate decarboxylase subunit delta [Telmatospirillum siberiense]|uniref:Malonate decarboxylase acyl carrier protein n=1 Tax=Telmatospirillum siberiense TaxID=382514 RepID=A0A2N3PZ90_9PROT|nr:malonate decarboxylase subunit delta [Telmatospirillum siberiense]PKU25734.1 malonate decarboxylase acyl carrier protein [Telmatospirillum siberiense]